MSDNSAMADGLKKYQEEKARQIADGTWVEPERLDPQQQAQKNPNSLRKAVTGYCWECMGSGGNTNWQWLVGNCISPDCSLFHVRPHQKQKGKPTPAAYDIKIEDESVDL